MQGGPGDRTAPPPSWAGFLPTRETGGNRPRAPIPRVPRDGGCRHAKGRSVPAPPAQPGDQVTCVRLQRCPLSPDLTALAGLLLLRCMGAMRGGGEPCATPHGHCHSQLSVSSHGCCSRFTSCSKNLTLKRATSFFFNLKFITDILPPPLPRPTLLHPPRPFPLAITPLSPVSRVVHICSSANPFPPFRVISDCDCLRANYCRLHQPRLLPAFSLPFPLLTISCH